jgi:hypothetical protein
MRNLNQYPVNAGEALDALQEAEEDVKIKYDGYFGNINHLALFYVEQFIRENRTQFDEFVKKDLV